MQIPDLPTQANDKHHWGNLSATQLAFALAKTAERHAGLVVVLTSTMQSAQQLREEIAFFLNQDLPILNFPDWETLPYDQFSPHQDIISERMQVLSRLPVTERGILLVPIRTMLHHLPPLDYIAAHTLLLKVGEKFDLATQRVRFEQAGYTCVSQVMTRGEFAVRGAILDIFPMGADQPYRIDLFADEVDSIRLFDPDTQRSTEQINEIHLLPAREFPLSPAAIKLFKSRWQTQFPETTELSPVLKAVSQGHPAPGIEYYLPMFFPKTSGLLDYLPKSTLLVQLDQTHRQAEQFWQEVNHRYEQYRYDTERPLLPPAEAFIRPEQLFANCKVHAQIQISSAALEKLGKGRYNFQDATLPELSIKPQSEQPLHLLQDFLSSAPGRVLFCAESNGRREALSEHLQRINLNPQRIPDWTRFENSDTRLGLAVAPLEHSLWLKAEQWVIITENQLFAQRVPQSRRRRTKHNETEIVVRDLTELTPGAAVVHLEHGVGRYLGLTSLDIDGQQSEFITLEYAGAARLYVPITALHLLTRYSASELEQAPLHSLGTDKWSREKQKAAQRIRDVAAELLAIYAKRAARQGFTCQGPDLNYQRFVDDFPFEETPDQASAIQAVLRDMESPQPMDRLLCGDVGFGKTEVAMRAAYLAVQNGKQVAILVPTTLLAQQHYENFSDRFADWPVVVEMLSRFRSAKEQTEILKRLENGSVDIIIGTHKLLGKELQFKRLGLLIIDEEHRFGVRHKEQIKALRAEVDILTMTATPIPRTLNMAMSQIRDLSIIATPPAKRLSVKTFVQEYKASVVKEAILREILRGGQVYFLHNSVETIHTTSEALRTLLPEISIGVAHGQMRERELEKVMVGFYHNRYNVLLCTTIIETGIDVPNANTIIIDRADKLGLAQLHQLRGRVGRSHHQAYAYLLTPPLKSLTADAKKRLDAIVSADSLGAGFTLASHDLEIRGAGELLGEEQSGNMHSIGYGLYMELLDRMVKALKSGKTIDIDKSFTAQGSEVDLRISALIPDDYLPDIQLRLSFYQRIAHSKTQAELDDLQVELIDRFGLLPESARHLFASAALRLEAEALGVKKLEAHAKGGKVEFTEQPNIEPLTLIKLIQVFPKTYQLSGPNKLLIKAELPQAQDRINAMREVLQKLRGQK